MKETKIVELVIEDDSEALAIDAISLVNAPAIETDFVFFGKEKNNLTFAKVDEEKRMIISPALIPNKQIFRYDPNTDQDYYVYFSPKTVRQASELYLKHNNHHKATEEHKERVAGVLTVESWIIQDSKMDKSALYGFSLPKGTWMVSMKIENDELWSKIKSGELKGLSIEGYFIDKIQKMKKQDFTNEEVKTALKELLSEKKSIKVNLDIDSSLRIVWRTMEEFVGEIAEDTRTTSKLIKDFTSKYKEIEKIKTQGDSLKKTLRKKGGELIALVKESYKLQDRTEKYAKELGIDPREIESYKNVKFYTKEADRWSQEAFNWENEIIQYIDKKIN